MALAKMTFDELNQLVGYKISEPFDEFYDPMGISEAKKQKRIELAERLDEVFLTMLMECFFAEQLGTVVSSDIVERTRQEYREAVSEVLYSQEYENAMLANDTTYLDNFIVNHGTELIASTLLTLYDHRDDPYYYSADRARAIAENDSNSIWGHSEYEEEVESGENTMKTWNCVMDGRQRDSHGAMHGVTIPIDEPFQLEGGECYYPRDDSLGMGDEEICGCRCWLTFS